MRITTTEPDGVLPARMYWLKIVATGTEASDDLSDAPNGTGPYVFEGRQTGVAIDLAANPDYWGGTPSISAVKYEFVTEAGTRLAGLKSGKYDLIVVENLVYYRIGSVTVKEGEEQAIGDLAIPR